MMARAVVFLGKNHGKVVGEREVGAKKKGSENIRGMLGGL